jgi:hypothetical protein
MELRNTLSTIALGGAVLVAIAGTASAKGHERWEGRDNRVGPLVEFNLPDVPYRTAYADGCGFYRMRWHETGRRYWLRRFEQCREYRS